MTKFGELAKRRVIEYGLSKFDDSDLHPQFIPYFNSGERVKVRFPWGENMTGTIGVTTGWKPVFLIIRTSRSISSPWTLNRDDKIIAVKVGRKYQEVKS